MAGSAEAVAWFAPFAHPAEFMFARAMDLAGISYEYEQHEFPIEFDKEGNPTGFFTPDFFLPDIRGLRSDGKGRYEGRFVEITTMRRSLVTKKHRKMRRAQKRYPQYEFVLRYREDIYDICFELGADLEMALLPDQVERYREEMDAYAQERSKGAGQ